MIGARNENVPMRRDSSAPACREPESPDSGRGQLIVLLWEHLLTSLRRAASQLRSNATDECTRSLERASDIVRVLLAALEIGGEMASRLAALHTWLIDEIGALCRAPDPDRLQKLIGLVDALHESWAHATAELPSHDAPA